METALGKLHEVLLALQPINGLLFKSVLHFQAALLRLLIFIITLSSLGNISDQFAMVRAHTLYLAACLMLLLEPSWPFSKGWEPSCGKENASYPTSPGFNINARVYNRVTWKMTERQHASKRTLGVFQRHSLVKHPSAICISLLPSLSRISLTHEWMVTSVLCIEGC